jgi:hypothetical protein
MFSFSAWRSHRSFVVIEVHGVEAMTGRNVLRLCQFGVDIRKHFNLPKLVRFIMVINGFYIMVING